MNELILIGLGSNLPWGGAQSREVLEDALARLEGRGFMIEARSGLYASPAWPPGAGPDFVNAAAGLRGPGEPSEILGHLHAVEAEFGRERRRRFAPRVCDLDLLAVGPRVLPDAAAVAGWMAMPPAEQAARAPGGLVLPHPRLHERAFVLVPLAEIAPGWVHPVLGRSVRALCEALPPGAAAAVTRL